MRRNLIYYTMLFLILAGNAQAQNEEAHYKQLYQQAKKYADVNLATQALNNLILLGKTNYKDSLASVYTNNGLYGSGYIISKELLTKKPNDKQLLNLMFINSQKLGFNKEALGYINALIMKEPTDIVYHYQKVSFLVSTGETSNALQAINTAFASSPAISKQLRVEGINGNIIAVPVQAELYRLKGIIYYQLKDNVAAKEALTKALQLGPNYKLAVENLDALNMEINAVEKK